MAVAGVAGAWWAARGEAVLGVIVLKTSLALSDACGICLRSWVLEQCGCRRQDGTGRVVRRVRDLSMGVAEVSSRYFGDVGSCPRRNAKGLASVRDPGRSLLAWQHAGQSGKDTPRQKHGNARVARVVKGCVETLNTAVALPKLFFST